MSGTIATIPQPWWGFNFAIPRKLSPGVLLGVNMDDTMATIPQPWWGFNSAIPRRLNPSVLVLGGVFNFAIPRKVKHCYLRN